MRNDTRHSLDSIAERRGERTVHIHFNALEQRRTNAEPINGVEQYVQALYVSPG